MKGEDAFLFYLCHHVADDVPNSESWIMSKRNSCPPSLASDLDCPSDEAILAIAKKYGPIHYGIVPGMGFIIEEQPSGLKRCKLHKSKEWWIVVINFDFVEEFYHFYYPP